MTLKLNSVDEAAGDRANVTAVLSIEARISEGSAVDQIEVVRSNMTKCFRVVAAEGLDQCSCVDPELLIITGGDARGLKSLEFLNCSDHRAKVEVILATITLRVNDF